MTTSITRRLAVTGALCAALGAVAIPTQSLASAPPSGEPIEVNWWLLPGTMQELIVNTAINEGIAAAHGFEIKPFPQTATTPYTALRAGNADVSAVGIAEAFSDQNNDMVQVIDSFMSFGAPIIAAPGTLESMADVEGKRFGTWSETQIDFMVMRAAVLEAYGFDLYEDTDLTIAAPGLLSQLLGDGDLDATVQFNDLAFVALQNGDVEQVTDVGTLIEDAGWNPDAFYLGYAVTEEWMEEHPDSVDDLQAMLAETKERLQTDDELWVDQAAAINIPDDLVDAYISENRALLDAPYSPDLIPATVELYGNVAEMVGDEVMSGLTAVDESGFVFPDEAS